MEVGMVAFVTGATDLGTESDPCNAVLVDTADGTASAEGFE